METSRSKIFDAEAKQSTHRLEYFAIITGFLALMGFTGLTAQEFFENGHVDNVTMKAIVGGGSGLLGMGLGAYKIWSDFLRSSVGWAEPNEN